jgi:hypothetical protein
MNDVSIFLGVVDYLHLCNQSHRTQIIDTIISNLLLPFAMVQSGFNPHQKEIFYQRYVGLIYGRLKRMYP